MFRKILVAFFQKDRAAGFRPMSTLDLAASLFTVYLPGLAHADDTPVGQMSGRVGTSLLTTLGLPELSFHGVKELEDAAVSLLKSPRILSILRKRQVSVFPTQPHMCFGVVSTHSTLFP